VTLDTTCEILLPVLLKKAITLLTTILTIAIGFRKMKILLKNSNSWKSKIILPICRASVKKIFGQINDFKIVFSIQKKLHPKQPAKRKIW